MKAKGLLSVLCASTMVCTQVLAAETAPPAPATSNAVVAPGYRPASDSDEAGLWMMSDRAEENIKNSPLLVRDAALNAYVRTLVCKLAKDQCNDIRIYILDQPYFNATMSPNGAMQVWTGLLLRSQNEAQLSCVLGHELSHYLLRHTLAEWKKAVNATGAMAVLAIVTMGVALIGAFAMANSLFAFSRDEEREADAHGQDLVAAAGYDPAQCAALWDEQLAEERAEPDQKQGFFYLRSHPTSEERLATMRSRAAGMAVPATPYSVKADEFLAATRSFRSQWLQEELNRAHFGQSLVLVNTLLQAQPNSGELQYYLGETFRRRNENGDAAKALEEYRSAIATGTAPAGAFRGLGLTAMKSGDPADARDAFQHYLVASPAADDRAMIEYYLAHLGEHS